MNGKNNGASLLDDIVSGAKAGADIGSSITGFAGAVVGGFAGATVVGIRWLIVKPLANVIKL